MSALYRVKYVGQAGEGGGAFYIGQGIVMGVDILGGTYDGTYVEQNGRLAGRVTMFAPPGGGPLVNGTNAPANSKFDLTFDFPSDLGRGQPQTMNGPGGGRIQVSFVKFKDLPPVARAA